jgi:hypothetical protein
MSNLTLLIPTHKEVELLPTLLDKLNKFKFKKIVILEKENIET